MATSKAQKVATLSLLQEVVAPQKAVVFLTTLGAEATLNASQNVEIRQKANKNNVLLKVIKNTLIQKTFGKAEGFPESIVGPTFVVFAKPGENDEIMVPKAIVEIVANEFKDQFKILGSVVNGEFYNSEKTIALAKTPSKLESMAKLAGVLQQLGGGKLASLLKEVSAQTARAIGEVAKTKTA
jgi:ribosomal protein L10